MKTLFLLVGKGIRNVGQSLIATEHIRILRR